MADFQPGAQPVARKASLLVVAALAAIVCFASLTCAITPAFAEDAAVDAQGSPCIPTDDQLGAYRADGTLDARVQEAELLGHAQPSAALTQQALARQAASAGSDAVPAAQSVPSAWTSGMASVGTGRVLALRVSFPDYSFADDDTLSALDALINGGGLTAFPYESLHAYYQRASYSALDISGETVDYQAKHDRSYYEYNVNELFVEALDALEGTLDLAHLDANGGGYLEISSLSWSPLT